MLIRADMAETMFSWLRRTPLGLPVDPEVYMMMAQSLGLGGQRGKALGNFKLIISIYP